MTIGGLGSAKAQNEAVKLVARETGASVNEAKTAIQEQFGNPIEDAAGSIFNFGIPSDLGSIDNLSNIGIPNDKEDDKDNEGLLDKLKKFFGKENEKEKNPGELDSLENDNKKEKNPSVPKELPFEDDSKNEKEKEKAASFTIGSFQTLPHKIKPGEENDKGSWHTLPHIIKPGEENNKGSWHTLPHKINPEDWGSPLEKMPKAINPDDGKELNPNDIFPKELDPKAILFEDLEA